MLSVRDLAYGYRAKRVGEGVSFTLMPGQTLVLLGPNGSGKTTLFKTLLGLLPVQGGGVLLGERPLSALGRREIAREVAYVPQASAGYFPFTVLDTVLMGRTAHLGLFAAPGHRDRMVAEETLELLGVRELAGEPFTQISGGQRQLVLVARALAQKARLLVMDEPTASLDFGNQVKVLEQVRRLSGEGIGVLLSTHDPDHAFQCGDLAALLNDGALYRFGTPAEVVTEATLGAVYGVDVEVHRVAEEGAPTRHVCLPR